MASLAADSDDYDWDLSVEDELLLTSLVGQQAPRDAFSPPASVSTGRRSTRSSSSKAHIGPTLAVARGVPTDEPASSLYDEKESAATLASPLLSTPTCPSGMRRGFPLVKGVPLLRATGGLWKCPSQNQLRMTTSVTRTVSVHPDVCSCRKAVLTDLEAPSEQCLVKS